MLASDSSDLTKQYHGMSSKLSDLHVLICFSYFCKMVFIFSSTLFYMKYVQMRAETDIQDEIHNNPRFWPYFKDATGALDGSHIHASPPL